MRTASPTSITSRYGRRMLARGGGGGLVGERAQKMRSLAARLIAGESVTPAEFEGVAPRTGGGSGSGIKIGFDWHSGEMTLDEPYTLAGGGVAVMEIGGAIMYRADLFDVLLFGALPTAMVVESLRRATADRQVRTLVMRMDTPGGSVAGCYELAKALDEFKAGDGDGPKRLIAVAAEAMFSMGVWMGCVADAVYTTPTGCAGSVGTIILQYDDSKMFEEFGITPYVIATHERKAQGNAGVAIDDALQDDTKRLVEKHWPEFRARVAAGRGMSEEAVEAMQARIYTGSDAVDVGLCDAVVNTFDELVAALVRGDEIDGAAAQRRVASGQQPTANSQEPTMPELKKATFDELKSERPDLIAAAREGFVAAEKPAGLADLQGAFPGGANAEFVLDCLSKNLTMTAAKTAHAERTAKAASELAAARQADLAAKDKDLEAKAKRIGELEALNGAGKGTPPVSAAPAGVGELKDPPAGASKAQLKAHAEAEWKANAGNCQADFTSEKTYVAYRVAQLTGRASITKGK